MSDHSACIAQLEALNAEHNRTVHELRRAVATLTEARLLAAELRPLVYARNPDKVDALLDLLLSGVPGGGEPHPGTDDNGPERARQMIDEVTAEHARTWPKPPAWAVRPIDAPVRPVAVGDQPDTPCPHCGGSGRVPTWFADTDATEPCPACTDQENPDA